MRAKITFLLILLTTIGIGLFAFNTERIVVQDSFGPGESYEYKIKYGFIPIGQANVDVHSKLFSVNNKPCYRINVLGRTTGLTDLFKVRNTYRSFVDTASILPQKFILSAREGNYKRDQEFLFDHRTQNVKRIEKEKVEAFKVPQNVQDVISGYYFLRTIDYKHMKVGQTVSAPLFFDDEVYTMKVKYAGKDVVKTRFGKINVVKLHPILPKNDLFEGEEAIRVWVSDDKNHVPIRLEVDFSIAAISMEMVNYKNTKYKFDWD
ncbi:Protein of unknown function [Spirosomataceae bacterium TFI 002]|nr:Protein of unknown function [Spirosomataceae bacterium TFI 002]